jgi:hypothetical protein
MDFQDLEIERPKVYCDKKLGKLLGIYIIKEPPWESLREFGISFGYCETGVSGYKCFLNFALWRVKIYLSLFEVIEEE